MVESRRPEYYEAKGADWQPYATYTLLGVIVLFYIAQLLTISQSEETHHRIFVINFDWHTEPWTLITATLSHDPTGFFHILINGLVLFFFGPTLERLIGWKRFVILFFVAGAVASVAQVYLTHLIWGFTEHGGLGASGAILMIFGALMIVMPNEKVLIWGIIPVPFWLAGIGFALLDLFGALNPLSGVGNFAHLTGMALGIWVGWDIREKMKRQGLRLVRG